LVALAAEGDSSRALVLLNIASARAFKARRSFILADAERLAVLWLTRNPGFVPWRL
jgi:hypothetical protein